MSARDDIERLGRRADREEEVGAWYNDLFGGVHTAGKLIATAFGGGALAQQAESLESPILPDWAKSDQTKAEDAAKAAKNAPAPTVPLPPPAPATPPAPNTVTVSAPDYVMVVDASKRVRIRQDAASVAVTGGTRFPGNGYSGGGAASGKFSFGFTSPSSIAITTKNGLTSSLSGVLQVAFGGGQVNNPQERKVMSLKTVLGALGFNFKPVMPRPAGLPAPLTAPKGGASGAFSAPGGSLVDLAQAAQARARALKALSLHSSAQHALSAPRAGFTTMKTPGGKKLITLKLNRRAMHWAHPEDTIKNARDVAADAVKTGKRLLSLLKKTKAQKKQVSPIRVHGETVGALHFAPRSRTMRGRGRPLPHFTHAQLVKMANDLVKSGETLKKHVDGKFAPFVQANKTKIAHGIANVRAAQIPGTKIHGDAVDYIGACVACELARADVLGDDLGPNDPDPTNPGYLIDGSPDPAYGGSSGSTDGTTDGGSGAAAPGSVPTGDPNNPGYLTDGTPIPGWQDLPNEGPPNYGCGDPPTSPPALVDGMDYTSLADFLQTNPNVDPNAVVWDSTGGTPGSITPPDGRVIFDDFAGHPWPFKGVASFTTFAGGKWNGRAVDGGHDSNGQYAGFEWHGTEGSRWMVYWPRSGNMNNASPVTPPSHAEDIDRPTMAKASIAHGWGPLIGDPGGDFKGLFYDIGADQWFWFYDVAPDWAKAPDNSARLAQAVTDYKTCVTNAAKDYTAAVIADQTATHEAENFARQQAADALKKQKEYDAENADQQHKLALSQNDFDQQMAQQQQMEQLYEQQAAFDQGGGYGGGFGNPTDDGGFGGGYGTGDYDPANPPDPSNPGYLMDGSPDPNGIAWGTDNRDQIDEGGTSADFTDVDDLNDMMDDGTSRDGLDELDQ